MNQILDKIYASPYGRLARRFVVVGLAAAMAFLFSKVDSVNPLEFINGLLALPQADWLDLLKVFVGAGLLGGLDKLKREWANL